MKTCKAFLLTVLPLAVLACSKERQTLVQHTLTAFAGEEVVKTVLNPSDDTEVLWSAEESVNVFVGNDSYLFTGTNTAEAATATFTGNAPANLGTYVMLSPYNASATKSSGTVSTTLPAAQTGHAGSFGNGTLVLSGMSSTGDVTCRHVCSGIRFRVTGSDISRVTLCGLNGEKIAGNFSFHFEGGIPVAGAGTAEEVTLTPSDGDCFTPGEWYYIAIIPTVFSQGICLTATSASRGTGLFTQGGEINFTRAKFKNKTGLDGAMTWSADAPSASTTCYGPANSFCLRTGESLTVDMRPRWIQDGWIRSSIPFCGAPQADNVAILWNTGSVTASLSSQTLTLNAGASEGTALVAIKNGSTTIWSFLVWVTASGPSSIQYLPSGAEMQEALGGGLYFQWGRKDPLRAVADHTSPSSGSRLEYSINHPDTFINGGQNSDWLFALTDFDNNLWGGETGVKTVWDPCPQGWKVPQWSAFRGLSEEDNRFTDWGYIAENGYYSSGITYWTATPSDNYYSCSFVNQGGGEYDYAGNARSIAAPVRCVRE